MSDEGGEWMVASGVHNETNAATPLPDMYRLHKLDSNSLLFMTLVFLFTKKEVAENKGISARMRA